MAKFAKNVLTSSEVARALRAGTPCELKDGGALFLIITGKNHGRWEYRGRVRGKVQGQRYSCGNAPNTGLSEARGKRDEYRALLSQGIDPKELKRKEEEEAKRKEQEALHTFRYFAEHYLATLGNVTPKTLQGMQGRIKNHMQPLLNLPIAEIRRSVHLKPLIDGLVQQGCLEQARRVGELIGRICAHAVDCGDLELNPAERLARLVPRQSAEDRKHHAAMTRPEDAARLFRQIWAFTEEKRSSVIVCSALKLYCYLPLRTGNLLGSKWEDVDLEAGVWTFPRTKNGREYSWPVSSQVRAILAVLKEYEDESGYCLPSPDYRPGRHVSDQGVRIALRKAGLSKKEQSLHGFRSVFQTLAKEYGCPHVLTEKGLFHVAGGKVQQAYDRTHYEEPLKAVAQWWCDLVDALRDGRQVPDLPEPLRGKFM